MHTSHPAHLDPAFRGSPAERPAPVGLLPIGSLRVAAAMVACGMLSTGCGTPWIEELDGEYRRLTSTLTSNGSGNIKITVRPEVGESAMLLTVQPLLDEQDCHIRTLQIGQDVPFRADQEVTSDRARTNAGYIGHAVSLNWPITEEDGFLRPRTTHKLQVGMVNQELVYTKGSARVSVLLKRDADLDAGVLKVNIIFAGQTGRDDAFVSATEDAVELWRQIYSRAAGIELEVTYFDFAGSGVLQAPGQGDLQDWSAISSDAPFGGINVVMLEQISQFDQVLGFAGDIPGPLVPSGRSAVAVNGGIAAGPDGDFSAGEVQLLAETMAHEAGHFLGLYHPVETTYDSWDALPDTPDCTVELDCLTSLGQNLMFPFPICDGGGCVQQDQLSPQQGDVANRYTGVL